MWRCAGLNFSQHALLFAFQESQLKAPINKEQRRVLFQLCGEIYSSETAARIVAGIGDVELPPIFSLSTPRLFTGDFCRR